MSLGIIPKDRPAQIPSFPPKKRESSNSSTRKIILVGSIVVGILTGGGYLLNSRKDKNPEIDKIVKNLGKITGVEHIHISK